MKLAELLIGIALTVAVAACGAPEWVVIACMIADAAAMFRWLWGDR